MTRTFTELVDAVLRRLLGPDDWLGQHPKVCLVGIALLLVLTEVITNG